MVSNIKIEKGWVISDETEEKQNKIKTTEDKFTFKD